MHQAECPALYQINMYLQQSHTTVVHFSPKSPHSRIRSKTQTLNPQLPIQFEGNRMNSPACAGRGCQLGNASAFFWAAVMRREGSSLSMRTLNWFFVPMAPLSQPQLYPTNHRKHQSNPSISNLEQSHRRRDRHGWANRIKLNRIERTGSLGF